MSGNRSVGKRRLATDSIRSDSQPFRPLSTAKTCRVSGRRLDKGGRDCQNETFLKIQGECPASFPGYLRSIVEACGTDTTVFSTSWRKSIAVEEEEILYHDPVSAFDLKSGLYKFRDRLIRVVKILDRGASENGWRVIKIQGPTRDKFYKSAVWRKTDAHIVQSPDLNTDALVPIERLIRLKGYSAPLETPSIFTRAICEQLRESTTSTAESAAIQGVGELENSELHKTTTTHRGSPSSPIMPVLPIARSTTIEAGQVQQLTQIPRPSDGPHGDRTGTKVRFAQTVQLIEGPKDFSEFPHPLHRKLAELEQSEPSRLANVVASRWRQGHTLATTLVGRTAFFKLDERVDSPVLQAARYSYGPKMQITVVFIPTSKGDGRLLPIMVKGGHPAGLVTVSDRQYKVQKWNTTGARDVVTYKKAPLPYVLRFAESVRNEKVDTDFVDTQQADDESYSDVDTSASRISTQKRMRTSSYSTDRNKTNKKSRLSLRNVTNIIQSPKPAEPAFSAPRRDQTDGPTAYDCGGRASAEIMAASKTAVQASVETTDSQPVALEAVFSEAENGITDEKVTDRVEQTTKGPETIHFNTAISIESRTSPSNTMATSADDYSAVYQGITVHFKDQDDCFVASEPFRLSDDASKLFCRAVVHRLVHPVRHAGTLLEISIGGSLGYAGLGVQEDWRRCVWNRLANFAPGEPVDLVVKAVTLPVI